MNDINEMKRQLLEILKGNFDKEIVLVCIGTDRSTGDSLAPLVGQYLSELELKRFKVYGTLNDPIHAVNLEDKMNYINNIHNNPYIIGIDACLGRLASVGKININNYPLSPGAGVGKSLQQVGESSITGIVNVSGFMEVFVLQSTRLSLVMDMAKQIVELIKVTDEYLSDTTVEELQNTSKYRNKIFHMYDGHLKKWLELV